MNTKQRKITIIAVLSLSMLAFIIFCYIRFSMYAKWEKIDLSSCVTCDDTICEIERIEDSDYIFIKGYAYFQDAKKIHAGIVLTDSETGESFVVPTEPVLREDLRSTYDFSEINDIGFVARVSKDSMQDGENRYEIGYLHELDDGSFGYTKTTTKLGK